MEITRKEYLDRVEYKNKQGQLHRVDGPAVEYTSGTKSWYLNGKRHRIDGPAMELVNGTKYWYLNGKLHREDGSAREYPDEFKFWCLNGNYYTEQDYNDKIMNIRLKRLIEL